MSDEQDNYTVGGFAEYQEGNHERDPDDVMAHTGAIRDEQVAEQMDLRALHHDPDRWHGKGPATHLDVGTNRDILRTEGSSTARRALENGDTVTLKHFVGDPSQQADMAGIKTVTRLQEIVAGPAPVIVILGEMGAGKSDFAGLLGQLRERWVDGNLTVGSNIKTLGRNDPWERESGEIEDGWVPNYPLLSEWVEQDGDPLENAQDPKLFIGDEFSSAGSGSGKQGHQVRKKMGPLVFKIRKYGGALIYIGHDESSIHPMLWRVGTIIKKESKKRAVVADRISSGKLQDVDPRPLEGVPPTDWSMATEEASDWSWTAPSGEGQTDAIEEAEVKQVNAWTMEACREQGMSARETSEFVPYSHATVSNWWDDIEDGGKRADWVANVERAIA